MDNDIRCPLCGSVRLVELQRYKARSLAKKYKQSFDVNVGSFYVSEYLTAIRCTDCDLIFSEGGKPGDEVFYNELYFEPLRLTHYKAILRNRRAHLCDLLFSSNFVGKFIAKGIKFLGNITDPIIAPLFFDMLDYHGHTMGLLLKNKS